MPRGKIVLTFGDLRARLYLPVSTQVEVIEPEHSRRVVAITIAGDLTGMGHDGSTPAASPEGYEPMLLPRPPTEPNLGLVSTWQLLAEVSARMSLTQNSTSGRDLGRLCDEARENLDRGVLDYRTIDSG